MYCARGGKKTLVLGNIYGSQASMGGLYENYPGFPEGVDGTELMMRMQKQAERFGAQMEPLPAGERNYLELYGIPPSFGVLRERFLANEQQTCHASINLEALEEVETIAAAHLFRRHPVQ